MAMPLRTRDNLHQMLPTLTSRLRSHGGAAMVMPEHPDKDPTDKDGPVRRRSPRPPGDALGGKPGSGGKSSKASMSGC